MMKLIKCDLFTFCFSFFSHGVVQIFNTSCQGYRSDQYLRVHSRYLRSISQQYSFFLFMSTFFCSHSSTQNNFFFIPNIPSSQHPGISQRHIKDSWGIYCSWIFNNKLCNENIIIRAFFRNCWVSIILQTLCRSWELNS